MTRSPEPHLRPGAPGHVHRFRRKRPRLPGRRHEEAAQHGEDQRNLVNSPASRIEIRLIKHNEVAHLMPDNY